MKEQEIIEEFVREGKEIEFYYDRYNNKKYRIIGKIKGFNKIPKEVK